MSMAGMAMSHLADYREVLLHEQSPVEAERMRVLAAKLRQALVAAGLSRQEFAQRSGLAVELIVAIENGYGRLETAQRVLRALAAARPGHGKR